MGTHVVLILVMWWVGGSLNSVTLEAGFEFWPGPLSGCLTLKYDSPSLGLRFLLCKMGRILVPTLEGCGEDEMRENSSQHMGGAQTMSSVGDVIVTLVTWTPGCWALSLKSLPT